MKKFKSSFVVPIFHSIIRVQVGGFKKLEKKFKDDFSGYEALTWVNEENNLLDISVAFKSYPTHTTLVHESVHVVNFILKNKGIVLDYDNDETQAYLTGYIVESIEKEIKKLKS